MKLKKKFLVKLAATLLAIPLILYGGIFLYFYFEQEEAPLFTYQISYDTDSNRSPAEFAKDADGKRVYLSESPDDLEQEQDTEAVACWDCYEGSWTEKMRNAFAKYLPTNLRAAKGTEERKAISCGRGVAQAGVDIGAGIALIVGGGLAFVIESLNSSKVELRKHRWDQTKYAFYFVVDGKLIKVVSGSVKKLAKHLAKSFKEGDAYAICEATTVAASVIIGPKVKANYKADGGKMLAKDRAKAKEKLDNFDQNIKNATEEINDIELALRDAKLDLKAVAGNTDKAKAPIASNAVASNLNKKISDLEKQKTLLEKKLTKDIKNREDLINYSPSAIAYLARNKVKLYEQNLRTTQKKLGNVNQKIMDINKKLQQAQKQSSGIVNQKIVNQKIMDIDKKLQQIKSSGVFDGKLTKTSDLLKPSALLKEKTSLLAEQAKTRSQQIKTSALLQEKKSLLAEQAGYKSLFTMQKGNLKDAKKNVKFGDRTLKVKTKIKQIVKSPLYLAQAVGDKTADILLVKAKDIAIRPFSSGVIKGGAIAATYATGRDARKSKPETLQDYLDSLPQTSP